MKTKENTKPIMDQIKELEAKVDALYYKITGLTMPDSQNQTVDPKPARCMDSKDV